MMMNGGWVNVSAAHVAQDAIGVLLARCRPAGPIVWQPSPAPAALLPQATPPAAALSPSPAPTSSATPSPEVTP